MPVSNPASSGVWQLITSGVTGGAASSLRIDLSAQYSQIRISVTTGLSGAANSLYLRLNNDSGGNYNHSTLRYDGSASGGRTAGDTWAECFRLPAGTTRGVGKIDLINLQTGLYRGIAAIGSAETDGVTTSAANWKNTADAVTRIDLIAGAGNLPSGTRYHVVGVPL